MQETQVAPYRGRTNGELYEWCAGDLLEALKRCNADKRYLREWADDNKE